MLHVVPGRAEILAQHRKYCPDLCRNRQRLHLIRPLGFDISEKAVRRADWTTGIWWMCGSTTIWRIFSKESGCGNVVPVHQSAAGLHRSRLHDGCYLFFGKETRGLPEDFLACHRSACLRIPMRSGARSLNLSNSVAITVYEALRQLDFPQLQEFGQMTDW